MTFHFLYMAFFGYIPHYIAYYKWQRRKYDDFIIYKGLKRRDEIKWGDWDVLLAYPDKDYMVTDK